MIGFTRTKRGQPSSVGFRKLRFAADGIISIRYHYVGRGTHT